MSLAATRPVSWLGSEMAPSGTSPLAIVVLSKYSSVPTMLPGVPFSMNVLASSTVTGVDEDLRLVR
jgi:hypothetical protein